MNPLFGHKNLRFILGTHELLLGLVNISIFSGLVQWISQGILLLFFIGEHNSETWQHP